MQLISRSFLFLFLSLLSCSLSAQCLQVQLSLAPNSDCDTTQVIFMVSGGTGPYQLTVDNNITNTQVLDQSFDGLDTFGLPSIFNLSYDLIDLGDASCALSRNLYLEHSANPLFNLASTYCGLTEGRIENFPFWDYSPSEVDPLMAYRWQDAPELSGERFNLPVGEYVYETEYLSGCIVRDTHSIIDNGNIPLDLVQDCELNGPERLRLAQPISLMEYDPDIYWIELATGDTIARDTDKVEIEVPADYQIIIDVTSIAGCRDSLTENITRTNVPTINSIDLLTDDCNNVLDVIYLPGFQANNELWFTGNGQPVNPTNPNYTGPYNLLLINYPVSGNRLFSCSRDRLFNISANNNCVLISGRLNLQPLGCENDETAYPLGRRVIEFSRINNPESTRHILTDESGYYEFGVMPGAPYRIRPILDEQLFTQCGDPQILNFEEVGEETVDITVIPNESCAALSVELGIARLRRCFENTIWVNYFNDGTIDAEDAVITLELDDFLNFIEASTLPSSIAGQTLTFDLSNVPPQTGGSIALTLEVSCDAQFGQAHCIDARISPNAPCPTPANWNGAFIELRGNCSDEGREVYAHNTGSAPTTIDFGYIIVEDGVMLFDDPGAPAPLIIGPIPNGDSVRIELPNLTSSYYIQGNQEPGAPGPSIITFFQEACSGDISTGFANQLPQVFTDWRDVVCMENTGSYDPNDKTSRPVGFLDPHYIYPETPIKYTVRFQNTGTDTAFTVVIRDTLSNELDLNTFQTGPGSHLYTAHLEDNNLSFTFEDIMLPDSFVNEPASNGFVTFTIAPKAELPLPTEITNRAGIYFDFNEPIITKTVLLTVDTAYLVISDVEYALKSDHSLSIYPNPSVSNTARLTIDSPLPGIFSVNIRDMHGRTMKNVKGPGPEFDLPFTHLPAGWYLVSVTSEQGILLGTIRLLKS